MNVMILGGKAQPAAPKPCAVHLELEARLTRIEACVAALEKALGAGGRARTSGAKKPKASSGSQARSAKPVRLGDACEPGKSADAPCVGGGR